MFTPNFVKDRKYILVSLPAAQSFCEGTLATAVRNTDIPVCAPSGHVVRCLDQRVSNPLGAQATSLCSESNSATLEILHRLFVFLRSRARLKRAEIPTLAGLRILLPRI